MLLLALASCGNDAATLKSEEDKNDQAEFTRPGMDPGIANLSNQIRSEPANAALYAARAEMWYEKNNFDNAIIDLQSAQTMDSTNLDYHYLLTDVYLDYYQSLLALKTIQRAVSLDPDNVESLLTQAEVQLILKQNDEALNSINEVTRVEPRNPDAYLILGHVFAEKGDTARAINSTQEAVEIDPDMIDGWITLGRLHAAIGSDLAGRFFDTAINLDPQDVTAIHAKADFLRDQNKINEAIALYRQTTEIDQQYVAGNFNAGLLYMELDSVNRAQEQFNIVVKNDPIHIRGYFFRGYTYELQGNKDKARENYAVALRFSPDYPLALAGMERVGE
mgnify:CR=1 FL=1